MNNVNLIIPSCNTGKFPLRGVWLPLGALSIATYLRNNGIEAKVLDNEIISKTDIIKTILKKKPKLIGMTITSDSYPSALSIIEKTESLNTKIVLGGPHATFMWKEIMTNQSTVDYVVVGDGEYAMLDLATNKDVSTIENLVWRDSNGKIIKNPEKNINLQQLPTPDRNFVNIEDYIDNYQKNYLKDSFPLKSFKRHTNIYSMKGCTWGKCLYCSRMNKASFRSRDYKQLWEEITLLQEKHQIDYIGDAVDNNSVMIWLKNFLDNKPTNISSNFVGFGRANEITRESSELFKEIGFKAIIIGVESGNQRMLDNLNKGIKPEEVYNAVSMLSKKNIYTIPTFILGSPGETHKTLKESLTLAKDLYKKGKIEEMIASVFVPWPGSQAYELLRQGNTHYKNTDVVIHEGLINDWIEFNQSKYGSNVNLSQLEDYASEIRSIAKVNYTLSK